VTGAYDAYQSAVVIDEGMPVAIDNCVFQGNINLNHGGAIYSMGGRPTITNCVFLDNHGEVGGAIEASWNDATVEWCTFAGNSAREGGALYMKNPYDVSVSHCTFAGNGAPRGGAIALIGRELMSVAIDAVILAFSDEGEGFYWDGVGPLDIARTDIHGNAGGDWIDSLASGLGENGNVDIHPLFCDAPAYDFTLMDASWCLPENNPDSVLIGAHGMGCATPTGVGENAPEPAGKIALVNHPNPFNPATTISFRLPEAGRATLGVYDIAGRLVRPLADRRFGPGWHDIEWDGRDAGGRPVSSGVYLVHMRTAGASETRKINLLR